MSRLRLLIVGASGTIGSAVARALERDHDVVRASRSKSDLAVDLTSAESIQAMYRQAGSLDAVVCAAGDARFKPFAELTDDDFAFSIRNKLMGQVNLVRLGLPLVRANGSFTLTSGVLAATPMPGSGVISLVNAALEGFTRAAALEAPRGVRVNVVSPPWVTETLVAYGMDPAPGLPADVVARAYAASVTGSQTGAVIAPA
jgi:NAD(P)-dependent dehydrogenase (short-subunit alcohol dehydrogenase family)